MSTKEPITAREAEASGDTSLAIQLYEKEISKKRNNLEPYERLLVLYRRAKQYRKELHILNQGIEFVQDKLSKHQKELFAHRRGRNSLLQKSRALAQKMGLVNRKGDRLLLPQPLEKWMNRKLTVQKKIKAQRGNA
ncbi:MAG: hypothetical protein JST39_17555 [Bacteroidetes bacterium]|nr:hypothetical protein [Bacteroidota bacterium]